MIYRYQFPAEGSLGDPRHVGQGKNVFEFVESAIIDIEHSNRTKDLFDQCFPQAEDNLVISTIVPCVNEDGDVHTVDVYTKYELAEGKEGQFAEIVTDSMDYVSRVYHDDFDVNIKITGGVSREAVIGAKDVDGEIDYESIDFYFEGAAYPNDAGISSKELEALSGAFKDTYVFPYYDDIAGDVLAEAKTIAESTGLKDVTTEKCDGLGVGVFTGGSKVAEFYLKVSVENHSWSELLPDGNAAAAMTEYGWDEFEAFSQAYRESRQFADAVESIQEPENSMEQ